MIYTINVKSIGDGDQSGLNFDIFVYDDETGHNAKSLCETPGAYDEVVEGSPVGAYFVDMGKVSIGVKRMYNSSMFCLVVAPKENVDDKEIAARVSDITEVVVPYLSVPETAMSAMFDGNPQGEFLIRQSIESVHYYESITENMKVYLPESAWAFMDNKALKDKMMSKRAVYILNSKDNVGVFQKSCDSEFRVELPTVEEIHQGTYRFTSLDLLKMQMPYRKDLGGGKRYAYDAIYHTPYYKIDAALKGYVPPYLDWIDGYYKNDTMKILPYEDIMARNIETLIGVDTSRYVSKIIAGLIATTPLGDALRRMFNVADMGVMTRLYNEIVELNTDDLKLDVRFEDIEGLSHGGFDNADIAQMIYIRLQVSGGFIEDLINNYPHLRAIDCDNVKFDVRLSDEDKDKYIVMLLDGGYLSSSMFDFLRSMCASAYEVHWGHSGVTKAIVPLVDQSGIKSVSEIMGQWVEVAMGCRQLSDSKVESVFTIRNDDYDPNDEVSVETDAAESTSAFDRYIAPETARAMMQSEVSGDLFNNVNAMSHQVAIVERWRKNNGNSALFSYLVKVYNETRSSRALVECFIKLSRWGHNKPKTLVVGSPDGERVVREVFDCGNGIVTLNADAVDDSMLVRHDGCGYSLYGLVCTTEAMIPRVSKPLIGVLLRQDYGAVEKLVMASWYDVGTMIHESEVDIAELKTGNCPEGVLSNVLPVEYLMQTRHSVYVSDKMVEESLVRHVKAQELSHLALVEVPGVLESAEYFKSFKSDEVITIGDLKYRNLRNYVTALTRFYGESGSALKSMSNIAELSELALKFYAIYRDVEGKGVGNKRVDKGFSDMDLFSSNNRNMTSESLTHRFFIVYDEARVSHIQPMQFSDTYMKKLSSKMGNCIVFLVMDAGDHFVICRKDAGLAEIQTANGRVVMHRYDKFGKVLQYLKAGKVVNLSKKRMYLHESMNDVL